MINTWSEGEVDIHALQAHFTESGVVIEHADENSLGIRSIRGFYLYVRIDEVRKFIRFVCFLDLDTSRSDTDRLELAQRLNNGLFLANFTLGRENDMIVDYPMSYECGLIPSQMMRVFYRFSSLIDAILAEHNRDHFIVFRSKPEEVEITDESEISVGEETNANEVKLLH